MELVSAVGVFPKASAEGNAAALDKALEALAAWLDKASETAAARIAHSTCSNIVSKALGARPSTAAKGTDCLAAFIVAEQSEKATVSFSCQTVHSASTQPTVFSSDGVACAHIIFQLSLVEFSQQRICWHQTWSFFLQAALIEGYANKVPKVVVGALDATLQLVR